jgi:hypothetical protein
MIRHRQGNDFLLITQDEHARLSGRLAEHFGSDRFTAPLPRKQVIDAIAMHDCGWPLHDDHPALNPAGLPLHVFESPISISTRVWSESARRAADIDPYTGLLVSLHVLALSATIHRYDTTPAERDEHRQELFLLNQFQQDQIELQDGLRRQLGLRSDIPLRLGLAKPDSRPRDEREDLLAFNYKLLKLMDRLSLELCCSEALPWKIDALPPGPGAEPIDIRVVRLSEGQIAVDPWPFPVDRLQFQVPFRRVPATPFPDVETFRKAYGHATTEQLIVQAARAIFH